MIQITLFLIIILLVVIRPIVIPYFILSYAFIEGLGSTVFTSKLTLAIGSINVYPKDLTYVLAVIYLFVYYFKVANNSNFRKSLSTESSAIGRLVLVYILFFIGKVVNGYFNGAPLDSLIRMFAIDTSVINFYLPLVIIKDENQLKKLLYFSTILALIFPICQPFLVNSEATVGIIHGQGTFRLGYGDANVLLAMGVLAIFCWEKKKYLAFLPLAGIMMLAHRSGYIAIAIAYMVLSFLQGKKLKAIAIMGGAITLMIAMLAMLQVFTTINILEKNLARAEETFEYTGTTKARAGTFPIIFEEFLKRPLTGLDYKELYGMTTKINDARSFNITHPHNFVLTAIATSGIIGTIILLTLLYRSLQTAYRLAKTAQLKKVGMYLFTNILFFIIYAAMNTTMGSLSDILWFFCGVTYWFFNQSKMLHQDNVANDNALRLTKPLSHKLPVQ